MKGIFQPLLIVGGLVFLCGLLLAGTARIASSRPSAAQAGTPPAASLKVDYTPYENVQIAAPLEQSIRESAVEDNTSLGILSPTSSWPVSNRGQDDLASPAGHPSTGAGSPPNEKGGGLKVPSISIAPALPFILVFVLAAGSACGLYLIFRPSRS